MTDSIASCKVPLLNRIEIFLIKRLYQPLFSPIVGNSCRFTPTCSNYGIQVLEKHSFIKANSLIVWRILRCQPFCKGVMTRPNFFYITVIFLNLIWFSFCRIQSEFTKSNTSSIVIDKLKDGFKATSKNVHIKFNLNGDLVGLKLFNHYTKDFLPKNSKPMLKGLKISTRTKELNLDF